MNTPEDSSPLRSKSKSSHELLAALTSLTRRFVKQQLSTASPEPEPTPAARVIPPEANPEDVAHMRERGAHLQTHTVVERNRHVGQRLRTLLKTTGEAAWREGDLALRMRAENTVEIYLTKSSDVFRNAQIALESFQNLFLMAQAHTEQETRRALAATPEVSENLPVLQDIETLLNSSDMPERMRVTNFDILYKVKDLVNALQGSFMKNRSHGGFWYAINSDPTISGAYTFLTDLAGKIPEKVNRAAENVPEDTPPAPDPVATSPSPSKTDSPFVHIYSNKFTPEPKKPEPKGLVVSVDLLKDRTGPSKDRPVSPKPMKPETVQLYYMAMKLYILVKHWHLMVRDLLASSTVSKTSNVPADHPQNLADILAFATEQANAPGRPRSEEITPIDLDGLAALRQKEKLLTKGSSEQGVPLSSDLTPEARMIISKLLQEGHLYRVGITSTPRPMFILRISRAGKVQLSWISNRLSYLDQKIFR